MKIPVLSGHQPALSLLLLLLLYTCIPAQVSGRQLGNKKITLKKKRVTVGYVFLQIEDQTELRFSYFSPLIDKNRKVNVAFDNTPLDDVLAFLLGEINISWTYNDRLISLNEKPGKPVAAVKAPLRDTTYVFSKMLDEAVVIAYGITTPRFNTGNVYAVKAADIDAEPISNPLLVLEGRVPGMSIMQTGGIAGTELKIQIRGKNSLSNGTEPLIIVDGIPYNAKVNGGFGSFIFGVNASAVSYINPGDIESIDVLKDADATAIYGSRGANGVVLITMKKGQKGKTAVRANVSYGAGTIAHPVQLLNTTQYLEMRRGAFKNDGVTPTSVNAPDLLVWDTSRYTNWQKEFIGGTSNITNAQLSVSGGDTIVQYLVSGSYRKETTVFPDDFGSQKWGTHFSISSSSANQRFKTTLTGSFLVDRTILPANDFINSITVSPNAPPAYDAAGKLNYSWVNPYRALLAPVNINVKNLLGNAGMQYEIFPGLHVKANLGYQTLSGHGLSILPIALMAPDQRQGVTGSSSTNRYEATSRIFEPQITYTRGLWKGKLEALIGGTLQQYTEEQEIIKAKGFKDDGQLNDLSFAGTISGTTAHTAYKYMALFGRVGYNWKEKYLLNLSIRRDGSSRYGPRMQYAVFSAIGAGWIFTSEKFARRLSPFMSYGKLRVSYGATGNDQIGDYQFMDRYERVGGTYQGVVGLQPVSLFNADYAWELTRKLELGSELGFLDNRILLSTSYYRYRSTHQLVEYPIADMQGAGTILANLPAVIGNSGWEFLLTMQNIQSRHFVWTTSFNISIARNRLLYYPGRNNNEWPATLVGKSLSEFFVYKMADVDKATGAYRFTDATGNIVSADGFVPRVTPVDLVPKYFGGLMNTFRYKQFQLEVLLQFTRQLGVTDAFDPVYQPGYQVNQYAAAVSNPWKTAGDVSNRQRFTQNGNLRKGYLMAIESNLKYTDASFIRCKNLVFSWQLPEHYLHKIHFRECKFSLQAQNLFTLTPYQGMDPETQSRTAIPPLRILMAGMQLLF
ncbi:SusC/RagA family TonB-linked outer membrane protein [Chitinophaga sp. CF118]|uniref:SusC/RagA family TonB-linked outer membrane protein n=1 Tax=Chitinophaga sp. CF118 TaxID=1884367 RepID=UPI0015A71F70|nr:SusC/RagA family TonB-linked outer membrane protein [Chitinophaga sp. CF118]